MQNIKDLSFNELRETLSQNGVKAFHADQIFRWLHKGVTSFDEMSDISSDLENMLKQDYYISTIQLIRKQVSKIDGTIKFLWMYPDQSLVESVLMRYDHGLSLCISTQIGCRQGCAFCASGKNGLKRNLSAGEILDQLLFAEAESKERISNIVLMGSGEPFDNYDNVVQFIKIVNDPHGVNIGQRHLTISTCGICDKIDLFATNSFQVTLSVSLHAPNDDIRNMIMPINRRFPIKEVLAACDRYFHITGRRVSFEYSLIHDLNDAPEHAKLLAQLLKGKNCHVNLIVLNEIKERPFAGSNSKRAIRFQNILQDSGISATIRRRLGPDIDAACGQLRLKTLEETE